MKNRACIGLATALLAGFASISAAEDVMSRPLKGPLNPTDVDHALQVAVPFAPVADLWMGDDWFHNGAFRQAYSLDYIYDQEATRKSDEQWWSGAYDEYDSYLRAGSAGAMAVSHGMEKMSAIDLPVIGP